MKRLYLAAASLLLALAAQGQGTVNFVNRITGTLDAPVFYLGTATRVVGGGATGDQQFVAQLYQVPGGPVGDPIPFRGAGAGAGYWVGAARTLAGIPEGGVASVKVVAWSAAAGATYEAAVASYGGSASGESEVFTMTTGGGLNPPAPMLGLRSFVVGVPEPAPLALALAGAVALWFRKQRK